MQSVSEPNTRSGSTTHTYGEAPYNCKPVATYPGKTHDYPSASFDGPEPVVKFPPHQIHARHDPGRQEKNMEADM